MLLSVQTKGIIPFNMALKFDEIGYWSEVKHDIIRRYALEYSKIISGWTNPELYHVYIDAFAGPGHHISKKTNKPVSGSPQIALNIQPPFKEYYFIENNEEKVQELQQITANFPTAKVILGDCNKVLLKDVFPHVQYEQYRRGLCLLDPYGLDLNWEVIKEAGRMKSIDMFLNFPICDMNRNVLWHKRDEVDISDIKRMNAYWGDDSWTQVAYSPFPNLLGEIIEFKSDNNTIAKAFKERLIKAAGFKNVPKPIPMKNSNNSTIYYLFFASQNNTANRIVTDIFEKYRLRGFC